MRNHATLAFVVVTITHVAGAAYAGDADVGDDQTLTVLGARDGVTLLAAPMVRGPENSDVRLPRDIVVVERGVERGAPAQVWNAAVFAGGSVAWVTADGALWIEHHDKDGSIDVVEEAGVTPELAVSPSGGALAYVKGPSVAAGPNARGAGVYVLDAKGVRCVTPGLAFADRPLFLDDDHLVVVGAAPSGIAGVHVAPADGKGVVVGVTNQGMRTGRPFLGAHFVPPPADHASMRAVPRGSGAWLLEYFDGRTTQRVELSAGVLR